MDPGSSLLPATVEELAAQERAERAQRNVPARQLIIIVLATCGLLIGGASAVVLAQPAEQAVMMPPMQPYSPLNTEFTDGFGQWRPPPGRMPAATTPSPAPSSPAQPGALAAESGSASPAAEEISSELTAQFWLDTWGGGYNVYVWLENRGPAAVPWTVRIQLPPGATINGYWEAHAVAEAANVVAFTSPYGDLAPDGSFLFGFYGNKAPGPFSFVNCDVNGIACQSLG